MSEMFVIKGTLPAFEIVCTQTNTVWGLIIDNYADAAKQSYKTNIADTRSRN
jgi:hypothetical protein